MLNTLQGYLWFDMSCWPNCLFTNGCAPVATCTQSNKQQIGQNVQTNANRLAAAANKKNYICGCTSEGDWAQMSSGIGGDMS